MNSPPQPPNSGGLPKAQNPPTLGDLGGGQRQAILTLHSGIQQRPTQNPKLKTHPPLIVSFAYLLVSHGSRDPRPQAAAKHLAYLTLEKLQRLDAPIDAPIRIPAMQIGDGEGVGLFAQPTIASAPLQPLVNTAVLELHPLPLHQQIQQVAEQAIALGYDHLRVMPLFLLPGVHVMKDVPAEVAIAQQILGKKITIQLRPHLGSHSHLPSLIPTPPGHLPEVGRILVSHGSRRLQGNAPVTAIAARLGAIPAYWSVPPSLESQVTAFVNMGIQTIAILPYFLFSGAITDAIARTVDQLSQQLPQIRFQLADPLDATPELANLLMDLMQN